VADPTAARLLEEDAAVQTGMGPIVDRTEENLSSSDAAVTSLRRILLEALDETEDGRPPPGSARSVEPVRLPNTAEGVVDGEDRWAGLTESLAT
jgi:hypothetical protein